MPSKISEESREGEGGRRSRQNEEVEVEEAATISEKRRRHLQFCSCTRLANALFVFRLREGGISNVGGRSEEKKDERSSSRTRERGGRCHGLRRCCFLDTLGKCCYLPPYASGASTVFVDKHTFVMMTGRTSKAGGERSWQSSDEAEEGGRELQHF